jgi:hypothetical protein
MSWSQMIPHSPLKGPCGILLALEFASQGECPETQVLKNLEDWRFNG